MESRNILEVGIQPVTQVLGLADVDDPAVLVAETVDPWVYRDVSWFRTVGRRVSHSSSLCIATDSITTDSIATDKGEPSGQRQSQETMRFAPSTATFFSDNGLSAGPLTTEPSDSENALP